MPATPLGPVPGLGYADTARTLPIVQLSGGTETPASAPVAAEVPVALVYNGAPFVVVMASPSDLDDLATGFSVTEGIVGAAADVHVADIVRHSRGVEVQMEVSSDAADRIAARRRGISARTGCGVCGVESIDEVLRSTSVVSTTGTLSPDALWRAAAALEARQPLNAETRSVHAAAFATAAGELTIVREDVGRHNALDKVLGALLRAGRPAADGFIVVTSRASYELVQKTAAAGVGLIAAVSRPTSLAIQLADRANITLVGLLRGRSANVYTHPTRLGLNPSLR